MPPCPFCNQNQYAPTPVGFTWWGGIIGPKILNHVQCPQCGRAYNGKTGLPNTNAIAIYMVVVGILVVAILGVIAR